MSFECMKCKLDAAPFRPKPRLVGSSNNKRWKASWKCWEALGVKFTLVLGIWDEHHCPITCDHVPLRPPDNRSASLFLKGLALMWSSGAWKQNEEPKTFAKSLKEMCIVSKEKGMKLPCPCCPILSVSCTRNKDILRAFWGNQACLYFLSLDIDSLHKMAIWKWSYIEG